MSGIDCRGKPWLGGVPRDSWAISKLSNMMPDSWSHFQNNHSTIYASAVTNDNHHSLHRILCSSLIFFSNASSQVSQRRKKKMSPVIWETANGSRWVVDSVESLSGRGTSHCSPRGHDPMRACAGLLRGSSYTIHHDSESEQPINWNIKVNWSDLYSLDMNGSICSRIWTSFQHDLENATLGQTSIVWSGCSWPSFLTLMNT